MEVKPGYKQTEVGVIPEEWDDVTIQKLVDENILAKPLDGNHGNIHPKSGDYVHYGIPFVMANNFANGEVDFGSCKFITKERADKLQKGFSISGDVLLTHKGTVGNTAIVGELSTEYIMLTPQVTYYRVTDSTRLSNYYLRQYFDSQPFQSLFKSLAGGGTRAYLGIVKQLALPVVVPPLPEQRAIATALSDVDALLGGLDRLIAKKRNLKQAAMQQLLTGQTRLPGFHGEWEMKRLGELIVRLKKTTRPSSSGRAEGAYPFFTNTTKPVDRFLDEADFDTEAIIANTGGEAYFNYYNGSFAAMADCFVFETRLVTRFLYYFLKSVERAVNDNGFTGSGIKHLDKKYFYQMEVRCPAELPEQTAIAAALSDMDAELAALEQRWEKTRALKQAMMQELLTGRTRLV